MQNFTLVSVVIPAYNRPEFLKKAIHSIISQSLSDNPKLKSLNEEFISGKIDHLDAVDKLQEIAVDKLQEISQIHLEPQNTENFDNTLKRLGANNMLLIPFALMAVASEALKYEEEGFTPQFAGEILQKIGNLTMDRKMYATLNKIFQAYVKNGYESNEPDSTTQLNCLEKWRSNNFTATESDSVTIDFSSLFLSGWHMNGHTYGFSTINGIQQPNYKVEKNSFFVIGREGKKDKEITIPLLFGDFFLSRN